MCDEHDLPPAVRQALEDYRRLLAEHGPSWGEDPISYVRQIEADAFVRSEHKFFMAFLERAFALYPGASAEELEEHVRTMPLQEVIRDALAGDELPDNLAALRLTPDGTWLEGHAHALLDGAEFTTTLMADSALDRPVVLSVDGVDHEIAAGGALLIPITLASSVAVDGRPVPLEPLARPVASARLRVRAGFPCRWTVVAENGQGWYPEGAQPRRDANGNPYFHGDDLVLDVPAEPLTVRVTRGMEYRTAETVLTPGPGRETLLELAPERLYDAAARGWYGGDMHVHMNWTGDTVGTPAQANAVQRGEDLHVLNLVAGNVASERVYDREALEHWAGRDLPWSDATHLARLGVEYRSDLLGHFYAFGMSAPPTVYHTGFLDTVDWPPNADASREFHELGAVLGYSHPFHIPFDDDAPPSAALTEGRNCTAREIVSGAALGLVDSLDVLNHSSIQATAAVYRHLVGAGNRLAVTAGTDTMLSFNRRSSQSSPPGWERVYARLDGPLTADAFAAAIRAGRTFATTGPWLEVEVNGHGPGDTLDLAPGDRVTVTARSVGPEVTRLELRTADGVVAQGPPGALTAELAVDGPTYVVAVATGPKHPRTFHYSGAHAHTSPVYLDVAGRHVARPADVRWCLEFLDGLETMIRDHARLDGERQLADHLELLDAARGVYRSRLEA